MSTPRARKTPLAIGPIVRLALLAALAVAGSVYAILRYYELRPPARAPIDAGEIPAPELEPVSD
jgi:hypothetical protein